MQPADPTFPLSISPFTGVSTEIFAGSVKLESPAAREEDTLIVTFFVR
jgi:hypothetical protein